MRFSSGFHLYAHKQLGTQGHLARVAEAGSLCQCHRVNTAQTALAKHLAAAAGAQTWNLIVKVHSSGSAG